MILFKFNHKVNAAKTKIEVIQAEDIETAAAMARQYCKENAYTFIDICPFVFPIKEYLEASNGGKNPPGKPEHFGQLIERRKLQPDGHSEIPGEPLLDFTPAKATATKS